MKKYIILIIFYVVIIGADFMLDEVWSIKIPQYIVLPLICCSPVAVLEILKKKA